MREAFVTASKKNDRVKRVKREFFAAGKALTFHDFTFSDFCALNFAANRL
jgi:hypothetical protein